MPKIGACRPAPPTNGTLRKYGLTIEAWRDICARQDWRCPVCAEPFGTRKLAIDHAHVRRYKKLRPEEKRRHVRGVLHSHCNRYVRGWLTLARATAILAYLTDYKRRLKYAKG